MSRSGHTSDLQSLLEEVKSKSSSNSDSGSHYSSRRDAAVDDAAAIGSFSERWRFQFESSVRARQHALFDGGSAPFSVGCLRD